jgi:hypothetical protein
MFTRHVLYCNSILGIALTRDSSTVLVYTQ